MSEIYESIGYKSLLVAVETDEKDSEYNRTSGRCRQKLQWIVERAEHYAEKTGLRACDILDAWEERRDYWYMNYYQECEQPEIKSENVRVFETPDELHDSIQSPRFRCPNCGEVSSDPYRCNSNKILKLIDGKVDVCNWKSFGLFGTLGKGIYVFVKSELRGQNIFMPLAWEEAVPVATSTGEER